MKTPTGRNAGGDRLNRFNRGCQSFLRAAAVGTGTTIGIHTFFNTTVQTQNPRRAQSGRLRRTGKEALPLRRLLSPEAWLHKAPIGVRRRCYAVSFVGLRKPRRNFDPHRPYQTSRNKSFSLYRLSRLNQQLASPDRKILGGAMTKSWVPWPTWVSNSRIRRWAIFSAAMIFHRLPNGSRQRAGKTLSVLTWRYWWPPTSSRWKCLRSED